MMVVSFAISFPAKEFVKASVEHVPINEHEQNSQ